MEAVNSLQNEITSRKKRSQNAPDDQSTANEDRIDRNPPRKKARDQPTCSIESLEPFVIFIVLPPVLISKLYMRVGVLVLRSADLTAEQVSDYLEGAINGDYHVSKRPFGWDVEQALGNEPVAVELSAAEREALAAAVQRLLAALNDAGQLQALWRRFAIVDKLLALQDASHWRRGTTAPYRRLAAEVWWVRTAAPWFDALPRFGPEQYLRVALSGLVLELLYRFVWAGYTLSLHRAVPPASATAGPAPVADQPDDSVVLVALGPDEPSEAAVDADEDEGEDEDDAEDAESAAESDSNDYEDDEQRSDEGEGDPAGAAQADSLPPAASVFFPHDAVGAAIDQLEATALAQAAEQYAGWAFELSWDISGPLSCVAALAHSRWQRDGPPTPLAAVAEALQQDYQQRLVPWLARLGVRCSGPLGREWSWHPAMDRDYVAQIFVAQMRSLSDDGRTSASGPLLELFPGLGLLADARASVGLQRASRLLHERLHAAGRIPAHADESLALLARLLDQRQALAAAVPVAEAADSPLAAIAASAHAAHQNQLRALDELIERTRNEYERLTQAADLKPVQAGRQQAAAKPRAEPHLHADPAVSLALDPPTCARIGALLGLGPARPVVPAPLALVDPALPLWFAHVCPTAAPLQLTSAGHSRLAVRRCRAAFVEAQLPAVQAAVRAALSEGTAGVSSDELLARLAALAPGVALATGPEEAQLRNDAERCAHGLGQKKVREAALARVVRLVHRRRFDGWAPLLPPVKRALLLDRLQQHLASPAAPPLCLFVTASLLWKLRWRSEARPHYETLLQLARAHPTRLRLVVLGTLSRREYANDLAAGLSDWQVEARLRLPMRTRQLLLPDAMHPFWSIVGPHSLPLDASPAAGVAEAHGTDDQSEEQLPSDTAPAAVTGSLREVTVLYPSTRVPVAARHAAVHSVHLRSEGSEAAVPAWVFSSAAEVDYDAGKPGTTLLVVAQWREDRPLPPIDQLATRLAACELVLQERLVAADLSATAAAELLAQLLAPGGLMQDLVANFELLVALVDRPTEVQLLATAKARAWVRAYADVPSTREADPRCATWRCVDPQWAEHQHQLARSEWRFSQPFKYLVLASESGWEAVGVSGVPQLRAALETALFDRPQLLPLLAHSGPLAPGPLLRHALTAGPVSALEHWLGGARDTVQVVLAGRPLQPTAAPRRPREMVCAGLMNVSLADPANWAYWQRELNLPTGWARVTLPAAVPPELRTAARDALAAALADQHL